MRNNTYPYYGPQYNYQQQTYLDKQKVRLIQDQNSSNTIMCRILSELENLVINFGYPGKKYFGYYSTMPNNFQDIINQVILQMKIFESSYKNFIKNNPNKQYIFPNNLQYMNVIEIINTWKAYLIQKAKETKNPAINNILRYYDEFINILSNGNLSLAFKNEFENLGKNSANISPNELRRIMNAGSTAVCYMNEEYSNIEEEVAKKGDYKVNVILNGDRRDNKFYNNMDKYDEKLNNYKKELYNNLYTMLGYLEKYSLSHLNQYKNIQTKYNKYINNNINKKEEIYNQYSFYLNLFYELYTSDKVDFEIDEKEINNIINDISFWKNNITVVAVKKELDNAIMLLKKQYENLK